MIQTMITAMSVADTVMITILTMTGSWCADARSVRITERMDGMSNKQKCMAEQDGICRNVWLCGTPCDGYREKCKLRPTYNSLQKTAEKVVHDLRKAFGVGDD